MAGITNAAGGLENEYYYDPYGNLTGGYQLDSNPFEYPGAIWDPSAGLYQMGDRYYDPSVGRFTQQDPLGGGYTYAGDDPINNSDPSGSSLRTGYGGGGGEDIGPVGPDEGGGPESGPYTGDYPNDRQTKNTRQNSWSYSSEGEARSVARQRVGRDPVRVGDNKLRSRNGKWQYRAKPGDVQDKHVHVERLNPETGEVQDNHHLRWP